MPPAAIIPSPPVMLIVSAPPFGKRSYYTEHCRPEECFSESEQRSGYQYHDARRHGEQKQFYASDSQRNRQKAQRRYTVHDQSGKEPEY